MLNELLVPEIGKEYHFFDDGKISNSRHYIATVLRVVNYNDADNIIVKKRYWNLDSKSNESCLVDTKLVDVWEYEKEEIGWLFNDNTDYFIECSIPEYDENNIWFVRTKNGGWFSMNIQSSMQGGRLDITGELYEQLLK